MIRLKLYTWLTIFFRQSARYSLPGCAFSPGISGASLKAPPIGQTTDQTSPR